MKIEITLNGGGGKLDEQVIDVADDYNGNEVSEQIHEAIECWVLAPGDSIIIAEVS
jgi:hypothetical protein